MDFNHETLRLQWILKNIHTTVREQHAPYPGGARSDVPREDNLILTYIIRRLDNSAISADDIFDQNLYL